MTVVDPMHNLLLGTAKHMMTIRTELKLIDSKDLSVIQDKVDSFITPSDVGRLPNKIASGFSGFTAEQWRNWTILFSLASLKTILPRVHYDCWHYFVKACHLLCRRVITHQQVDQADKLLQSFLNCFEQIYGKRYCNTNLHLHGHLASCLEDYGPVYSFWLFAFERLNGVMEESFHTNSHNIPAQLTKRFLDMHRNGVSEWPIEYKAQFAPLLEKHRFSKGSLIQTSLEIAIKEKSWNIQQLPPIYEMSFELHQLREVISKLYASEFTVLPLIRKGSAISIDGHILGSKKSRYTTSSIVMARQLETLSASDSTTHLSEIQYFFWCDVLVNETVDTLCFVAVAFFNSHPCKVWYGYPTQVWSCVTKPDITYLPISHIESRVAYSKQKVHFGSVIGEDSVLIITPLYTPL